MGQSKGSGREAWVLSEWPGASLCGVSVLAPRGPPSVSGSPGGEAWRPRGN